MPDTASDRAFGYAPSAARPIRRATRSMAQAPNMAWRRFLRAARRQALVFAAVVASAVLGGFIQRWLAPSVHDLEIMLSWIGAGFVLAFIAAAARESWRDAIGVSDFGAKRRYQMLGAAPELTPTDLRQLPPDRRSPVGLLAFQPASSFATAFRDLQHVLPARGVVAFIAPAIGEGATTTAMCAAISATQQDKRVLIIDCDLRQRALTKTLGIDPPEGVLEACIAPEDWRAFIAEEEETGLHFIPAARARSAWRGISTERAGFEALLRQARAGYDLVILDCPPVGTADGPIVARLADKDVVVAAWDQTPRAAIRETMRALRVRKGGAGVYVNRVPSGYRFGRLRAD